MRFWSGFAAGVAITTAAVFAVLAGTLLPGLRAIPGEFKAGLPPVSAFATSPAWTWGVPVAVVAAVVVVVTLVHDDRRQSRLLFAIAATAVAAIVFTVWAAYYPIFQVVPQIRAD